jgi:hypothetical protein
MYGWKLLIKTDLVQVSDQSVPQPLSRTPLQANAYAKMKAGVSLHTVLCPQV